MEVQINSESETRKLAARVAPFLRPAQTIGFFGELGAGKTTFVRFLCDALQVAEPVSSPSFVLEHEYHAPNGLRIEHWDLYRLTEPPHELLEPPDAHTLRLVEWIDRAEELRSRADLLIEILLPASNHCSIESRFIRFSGPAAICLGSAP